MYKTSYKSFYTALVNLPKGTREGDRVYQLGRAYRVTAMYSERQLAKIEHIDCSHETLPYSMVDLVKTSDKGFSIVSKYDMAPGVCVGIGWYVNADAKKHLLNPTSSEIDKIRTPLGGFINHSNTPNCEVKHEEVLRYKTKTEKEAIHADHWLLYVSKPVLEGDELLVNYDAPVILCPNRKCYK